MGGGIRPSSFSFGDIMTDSLMIGATGKNFSAPNGSASAGATIPTGADGTNPKYVRVSVSTGAIYFRLSVGASNAVTTDTIIAVSDSQIFSVSGNTHFSAYGIGAVVVGTITPLENAR